MVVTQGGRFSILIYTVIKQQMLSIGCGFKKRLNCQALSLINCAISGGKVKSDFPFLDTIPFS